MNTDGVSFAISIDLDKQLNSILQSGFTYLASVNEIHKYVEFEKVTRDMFDRLKEDYKNRGLI